MTAIDSGGCSSHTGFGRKGGRHLASRGISSVGETSGDRIVQRALGPLPDLNSFVFFRKGYRDFVIGRGPMPIRAGKKARAFMRGGMWLFLVTGVPPTLTVGAIELFR